MPTPTTQALIITDDADLGARLIDTLSAFDMAASVMGGEIGRDHLRSSSPEFVIADLDLGARDPLDVLRSARHIEPSRLLLLAGPDSLGRVAEASEMGWTWYQKKPIGATEVGIAVRRVRNAGPYPPDDPRLLGSSPGIQSALKLATQMASRSGHLTVMGEPGVGKRLLGRLIHEKSSRSRFKFRHFSCGGLSESIVDAELFGRDSVPGSDSQEGLLGLCHQGTLMIEEISELPARSQQRLLKCMTLKSMRPLGSRGGSQPADVRIIASSSAPIADRVASGAFMRELFDRISGVCVDLKPLRERPSDIPVLVDHFVRRAGERAGRPFKGIRPDGLERLMRHTWPGNVRELEDMIHQAMEVASGPWLDAEDLPALPEAAPGPSTMVPGSTIQEIEKEAILRTMEASGGSTGKAAKILNMSVRKIQYKLKEYRRESASTLRSETVSTLPPPAPPAPSPVPTKKTIFVADGESHN